MSKGDREIEETLLLEFFAQATSRLDDVHTVESPPVRLSVIRQIILTKQAECLQSAIDAVCGISESSSLTVWTPSSLEKALSRCSLNVDCNSPDLQVAMEALNEAARLAFCRCAIYSECMSDRSNDTSRRLILDENGVKESDVLEFCGLCLAAVRLPEVKNYLLTGTLVFGSTVLISAADDEPVGESPASRLQRLQCLFWLALGYDADFGTNELKRICFDRDCLTGHKRPLAENPPTPLHDTVHSMVQNMGAAVMEVIAARILDQRPPSDEDSTTRIVSVSHCEKLIDCETGEDILTINNDEVPSSETMNQEENVLGSEAGAVELEERRLQELRIAHQVAVLQEEILSELLSMQEEERCMILQEAKDIAGHVSHRAMELPIGPERISYMTTLDFKTQRFMAMHKIWNAYLASKGL